MLRLLLLLRKSADFLFKKNNIKNTLVNNTIWLHKPILDCNKASLNLFYWVLKCISV